MKTVCTFFYTLLLFTITTSAQQLNLDVDGHVKIRGKMDISHTGDTTSVYIGQHTGDSVTTSFKLRNTFVGAMAGAGDPVANSTVGTSNSFYGYEAGHKNKEASFNSFFGLGAGRNNNGSTNSFFGCLSGNDNTTGEHNSFFGYISGNQNTTGEFNALFGYFTGFNNKTGHNNSFFGTRAGLNNTTGNHNSCFGYDAGLQNETGFGNTSIGYKSGPPNGFESLNKSIAIGYESRVECSNCAVIGGIGGNAVNVGIGTATPTQKLHVIGNRIRLASTSNSGKFLDLRTDGGAIDVSATGAKLFLVGNDGEGVVIQQSTGNVAVGNDTSPDYKLEVVGSAGKPGGGSWSNSSDRRLKKDIEEYTDGLEEIMAIRPVWYRYNGMYGLPTEERYVGVIAQEIQEIAPYTVTPYMEVDENGGEKEYLSYNSTAVTYMLVNAVQDQQAIIKKQQQQIDELRSLVEVLIANK